MGCNSSSAVDVNSPDSKNLPKVIFITGAPGSGKRTQCAKVVEKYGFAHLNVLDCLKEEVKKDTPEGKQISAAMTEGKLVESKLVCEALRSKMDGSDSKVFLVEGFPKSLDNLDAWNKCFRNRYNVAHCFYFHCNRATLEKRLKERAETSGRQDDSEAMIKVRLDNYEKETRPVVDYFEKSKKIIHINSERKVEMVFNQIAAYVDLLVENIEVRLPEVVFVSGSTGSGRKSTTKNIKKDYPFTTISCGEVLAKSERAKEAMEAGKLVDSELVVNLIADEMDNQPN